MSLIRALVRADGGWGPLDDRWYGPVSGPTASGINVSAQSALTSSPIWAATRIKADALASLPLLIYRRRADGGKDRAPEHAIYDLLHDAPNPLMTAYTFKRVMEVWRILWGNAYAEIRPGPRGVVDTLWPLHPDGVRVESIPGGKVRYLVCQEDGRWKPYADEDIFHLPGLSLNGISGLSLIAYARESIAINIGAKSYSSSFLRHGGTPSGVLTHPGKLSKDGRQNMREEWYQIHGGPENAHKIAILQEGTSWVSTGMTSEDAQLIELLEWSAAEASRFINVPLHMLSETSKVTSWGSGIEELNNGFVTWSLLPDLVNWQQSVSKDLITSPFYFAEFVIDALLRGKTLERFQAYQIASGSAPWLTPNEIRAAENRNPVAGGDELQKPATPPAPRPPAAPPSNQPKPPNGLAEALARDTAARIVRREAAALERSQRRRVAPFNAETLAEHVEFVRSALHISDDAAAAYGQSLAQTEIGDWLAGQDQRIEYLITLALEAQE